MYVEAIVDEDIDTGTGYVGLYKGDSISGTCRSYKQDWINVDVLDENPNYKDGDDPIDMFIWYTIRVKVKPGSIKRVYCYGCSAPATREDRGDYLCNDCVYESPCDERLDTGYHAMDYMRDWDD